MSIKNQKRLVIILILTILLTFGTIIFQIFTSYINDKQNMDIIYDNTIDVVLASCEKQNKEVTEEWIKTLELTPENLEIALEFYDIEHADIVMSQAIIETGHFKSHNCKVRHNLFGLVNSRQKRTEDNKNRYFIFNHWTESVKGYKDYVQYKYTNNKSKWDNDYYVFLERLGYAEDPTYVSKVKYLTKKRNNELLLAST